MTSIFEQPKLNLVENDILHILEKYKNQEDDIEILKEIINTTQLIMQRVRIQ